MSNLKYEKDKPAFVKYGTSKAGNLFHAKEYARRFGSDGIVSVALNPGNLKSDLQRHLTWYFDLILKPMLYTPIHGAYTELFAGLSPEVTIEKNGAWSKCHILPFE